METYVNFIPFLKYFFAGFLGIRKILLTVLSFLVLSSFLLLLFETTIPPEENDLLMTTKHIKAKLNKCQYVYSEMSLNLREVYSDIDLLEKQIKDMKTGKYIEELSFHSFLKSLYLTLISFTTIGFGDVVPRTICGRILTVLDGFLGIIMIGIVTSVGFHALRLSTKP